MSKDPEKPDAPQSGFERAPRGKLRIIHDEDMAMLGDGEVDGHERQTPSTDVEPERERGPDEGSESQEQTQDRGDAQRKGSCPSWLKSRVYKGGRPKSDDKGLLELQELIIRHSPVGTAVLDNRGRVRLCNDVFLETIGLETDNSPKDIDEVSERFDDISVSDKFWDAVETGSLVDVEEGVRIKGRGKATIHMTFRPVALPNGMSWCICYFEDISKAASARQRLYEYQNYVANVATSSGDAIIGLALDGAIKYWNQGAQALFGYTEDEVIGRSVMELVPEELRREAQLVLKVVKEKGIYRDFDTQRLAKNGQRIPVTMTVTAVRDDDGDLIGTAATLKDLRTTKDLHEKALEAEKLNAVLQMAVSVYHKINNPLCVIAANAQLLIPRFEGADSEEAKKLQSILEATKRISSVLEDLTKLTGVEPDVTAPIEKD